VSFATNRTVRPARCSLGLALLISAVLGCDGGAQEPRRPQPATPQVTASTPQPAPSSTAPPATASPSADPKFSPGWAKVLPDGFVYFNDSLSKLGRAPVEAVVVPAAQGTRFYLTSPSKQVTYFTPTLEQVFRINDALLQVTRQEDRISQRIIEYRYQLVGIDDGTKRIFVNAFCRDHDSPRDRTGDCHYALRLDAKSGQWVSRPPGTCPAQTWLRQLVLVDDGGACYFNFKYHPDTGAISDLQVNGEA